MKNAIPPIVMADLGSYRICGARNADTFLESVRGKSDGSGCAQEGFIACNPDAEPENMLCVA